MIKTEYPRPCPIPGHPQDEDEPVLVTDSAWSRLRAWHLHAPAERLPLPVIVTAWPSAWILHAAHVPGHVIAYATLAGAVTCWLTWHRHTRSSPHPRLLPTEAALVAAAIGGWIAAAATWGPLGWPAHLLTWIYLAGSTGGYAWLRLHEAVRAARQRREDAAAWAARKAEWHRVAHLIGLGDFHLQKVTPTLLGEELLLTSAPGSDLASRVARNGDAIAEKYVHLEGLPYGRVDISTTDYPGQLVIGIRRVDPSVKGTVYHPLTTPWPSPEPSPYAGWFPARATIRDPVPVGIIPETGEPMTLTLFDDIGAKAIGVHGATGSGKSTLLNDVRERLTAMTDAALVQLNGAHMGDELTWQPLAAATACGPAASDEDVRGKILAVLEWAQQLVTERSATLAETGHSVFQPTPEDPAIVLMADEVDEIVASVPGAGAILEFLASKGYFQVWDPQAKEITARGRTFLLGVPPDELAYCKRIVDARKGTRRTLPAVELAMHERQEHAPEVAAPGVSEMRARLATVRERNGAAPPAVPGTVPSPPVPGVPPEVAAGLVRVLTGKRLSASEAGAALGMSKSAVHRYLSALRDAGVVEMEGAGNAVGWRLPAQQQDTPPQYTTLVELAEAVHDGGAPANDEQRAVLEQVWQITHRPHLTILQGGGGNRL